MATPPLQSLVKWESENKMVCEQRLLKGEGPKTSWTRELTNDGELILVSPASSQRSLSLLLPRGVLWGTRGAGVRGESLLVSHVLLGLLGGEQAVPVHTVPSRK